VQAEFPAGERLAREKPRIVAAQSATEVTVFAMQKVM
jgi:hypothetical protein